MPRTLLAIYTCHAYDYNHDSITDWCVHPVADRISAIRDTWLKDVTVDYKLFYGLPPKGNEREPREDEIFLNAPDNYFRSSDKTSALIRWALANGYDRLLKVDDDVFVHWDRMVSSKAFTTGDYVGGGYTPNELYGFGPCYWLSGTSMKALSTLPRNEWAEDRWVGLSLAQINIPLTFEYRYYLQRPSEDTRLQYVNQKILANKHRYIALHAMNPEMMRRYYANTVSGRSIDSRIQSGLGFGAQ